MAAGPGEQRCRAAGRRSARRRCGSVVHAHPDVVTDLIPDLVVSDVVARLVSVGFVADGDAIQRWRVAIGHPDAGRRWRRFERIGWLDAVPDDEPLGHARHPVRVAPCL